MKLATKSVLMMGVILIVAYSRAQVVTNPLQHALTLDFEESTNHGSYAYRLTADISGDGEPDQLISFETWDIRYGRVWSAYRKTTNGYVDLKTGVQFSENRFILDTNSWPRILFAQPEGGGELLLGQIVLTNDTFQESVLGVTTNDVPPSDATLSNLFEQVLNNPDTNLVDKISL